MRKGLWALILALCLTGCAAQAESDVWMYALSVGKADAILVGLDDYTCLIDTGYARSRARIMGALKERNIDRLDAVFVTHTDKDHAGGLEWLAESDIQVDHWYASAMYIDVKESKHPAVKAAKARGQAVEWLQAGDAVQAGNAVFRVLAPISKHMDKDDNNSLVMMLETSEGRLLLAGDMEFPQEAELLAHEKDLKCDVLKVANHADDDTASAAFVRAARPQIAVICTDSAEKPETPDPRVLMELTEAGAETFVTQQATGGILVRLKAGVATAEAVQLAPSELGVEITAVEPDADRITLENRSSEPQALAGCFLYSDRGEEVFAFPDDAVIAPNEPMVIGTKSSPKGAYAFVWDAKKVVHKSKQDTISLYDAEGRVASAMSNGF